MSSGFCLDPKLCCPPLPGCSFNTHRLWNSSGRICMVPSGARPKAAAALQPSSSALSPCSAPPSRRTAPARAPFQGSFPGPAPQPPLPSRQTKWRRGRPHAQGLLLLPITRQPIRARRGHRAPRPRKKRGNREGAEEAPGGVWGAGGSGVVFEPFLG